MEKTTPIYLRIGRRHFAFLLIQNVTMATIVSAKMSLTKKKKRKKDEIPKRKAMQNLHTYSSTIPQDSRDHVCVGFPVGLLKSYRTRTVNLLYNREF